MTAGRWITPAEYAALVRSGAPPADDELAAELAGPPIVEDLVSAEVVAERVLRPGRRSIVRSGVEAAREVAPRGAGRPVYRDPHEFVRQVRAALAAAPREEVQ